jgi:predicted RNA-binding Zn-ribbon protein involved in translation (DUF1610 family)
MNNQPTAHIALNNNRLKSYGDVVYLKDGDEFQIELFNPYQVSVLAKIWINDQLISTSGLVLRPGQRYFLDRYIDQNAKFKFNTYTVDAGTTPQVLESIKNNGSVKVLFYPEKRTIPNISVNSWINPSTGIFTTGTNYTNYASNTYTTSTFTGDVTAMYSAQVSNEIETGRVEKGAKSSQNFSTTNQDFEWVACETAEWKILPDSHRPIEVKEIRNYCSSCGTRMKKQTWKFCPNCGEKL